MAGSVKFNMLLTLVHVLSLAVLVAITVAVVYTIMSSKHCKNPRERKGIVDASTSGTIDIPLTFKPNDVNVELDDDEISGSCCDPHQDRVGFETCRHRGSWVLRLTWTISGPRRIKWSAAKK